MPELVKSSMKEVHEYELAVQSSGLSHAKNCCCFRHRFTVSKSKVPKGTTLIFCDGNSGSLCATLPLPNGATAIGSFASNGWRAGCDCLFLEFDGKVVRVDGGIEGVRRSHLFDEDLMDEETANLIRGHYERENATHIFIWDPDEPDYLAKSSPSLPA